MVTKDDACWIIGLSAGAGIGVYLDGGWRFTLRHRMIMLS